MKPERWPRINDRYYSPLEREASQRAAFLDKAWGDDEVPGREVRSSLAASNEPGCFLTSPAVRVSHCPSICLTEASGLRIEIFPNTFSSGQPGRFEGNDEDW
jgi:hypothetical protein